MGGGGGGEGNQEKDSGWWWGGREGEGGPQWQGSVREQRPHLWSWADAMPVVFRKRD